jgi:hypothetical protein
MELAIIVAAAVAITIGWHASKTLMTHRGIPVRRGQLRDYRRERMANGIRTLGLAALLALILVVVVVH